ncbi:hypothetical protein WCLP8_5230001 [uncultured Gammaproteobacteria bacterium]
MPTPILTDDHPLRRLANDRSFSRGEAYLAQGQVRALRFDGERITATVRGGQNYRVRLWRAGGDLGWSCTCPVGEDGAFCKHAVAVGLAWIAAGGKPADDVAGMPTIDDIRSWLTALDKAELVEMIVAQSRDDERLHQKLMLGASRRRDPAVNLGVWRGAIDQALGDCAISSPLHRHSLVLNSSRSSCLPSRSSRLPSFFSCDMRYDGFKSPTIS